MPHALTDCYSYIEHKQIVFERCFCLASSKPLFCASVFGMTSGKDQGGMDSDPLDYVTDEKSGSEWHSSPR